MSVEIFSGHGIFRENIFRRHVFGCFIAPNHVLRDTTRIRSTNKNCFTFSHTGGSKTCIDFKGKYICALCFLIFFFNANLIEKFDIDVFYMMSYLFVMEFRTLRFDLPRDAFGLSSARRVPTDEKLAAALGPHVRGRSRDAPRRRESDD